MDIGRDQIVARIGQLAEQAERDEQETAQLKRDAKTLFQQRDNLADELETLIQAVLRISRSHQLRERAEKAQKALTANTQEPLK